MELSPSKHLRAQYSEEDSRRDVTFLEIYKRKTAVELLWNDGHEMSGYRGIWCALFC